MNQLINSIPIIFKYHFVVPKIDFKRNHNLKKENCKTFYLIRSHQDYYLKGLKFFPNQTICSERLRDTADPIVSLSQEFVRIIGPFPASVMLYLLQCVRCNMKPVLVLCVLPGPFDTLSVTVYKTGLEGLKRR
jgi:hypothetical protein